MYLKNHAYALGGLNITDPLQTHINLLVHALNG